MKISYAITVWNERKEIEDLFTFLHASKRDQDEIVILMDEKGPDEVWEYLQSISSHATVMQLKFNNDFSDLKNKLTAMCTGDWIFQIDADEMITEDTINYLPEILEQNSFLDMILVPRVNTVDGLTMGHIQKWKWRVNDAGWVNWPDYQMRIYRNTDDIQWTGRVHEKLTGYRQYAPLPQDPKYALQHHKKIARQEKQNQYYDTL